MEVATYIFSIPIAYKIIIWPLILKYTNKLKYIDNFTINSEKKFTSINAEYRSGNVLPIRWWGLRLRIQSTSGQKHVTQAPLFHGF